MRRHVLCIMSVFFACIQLWTACTLASALPSGQGSEDNAGYSSLWDELSEGFDYSLRFLTFGTYQAVADSTQNPDNDFLQIPRYMADLDLRPDAILSFRRLDVSIKPRMNLRWSAWENGTRKGDEEWEDDWFINEWLARMRVARGLFVSYGRENLQWGPAFLYSPSNPFFLDNGRSNPKREVPGMDFARIVWLPGMEWTISFIGNTDKGRQELISGDFEEAYALKLDYSGQKGYAGLILSRNEVERDRFGAFGGCTATDALLLYTDFAFSRGSDVLYPVEDDTSPFGASMQAVDEQSSSLKGALLVGGSYTFLAGPTLTVEYLYHGFGYNDDQADYFYRLRRDASDAYGGPLWDLSRMTLGQTADPGLRFLRRNYGMLQYNHNDIKNLLNLTFRWTQNLDDGSGQFISIVDCLMGDHTQLFFIGTVNFGNGNTEFGTIVDSQWMIGLEYTF